MDGHQTAEDQLLFFPDQPATKNNDRLEDWTYAGNLADTILAYRDQKSIVFGLSGPPGSGKSTTVGMTLEHIKEKTQGLPKRQRPIIVKFSPWNFSEQNQLIKQFFLQLHLILRKKDYAKTNQIGKALVTYSGFLEPLPKIGLAAKLAGGIGSFLKKMGALELEDLNSTKRKLNQLLEQEQRKIIVVIDEIDQLTNQEMRQIFHLVKSLADFSNTVYLMAFDKSVATKALASVQEEEGEGAGEQYLDKVVQVFFSVPLVSAQELEELLFEQLDKFLHNLPQGKWDHARWVKLYYGVEPIFGKENGGAKGFHHFFKSFRDVKRFVNSMSLSFGMVRQSCQSMDFLKVNPVDFLAITAIQVFYHPLYREIRNNKQYFSGMFTNRADKEKGEAAVGDIIAGCLLNRLEKAERSFADMVAWEEKKGELKGLVKANADYQILEEMVQKLFPKFDPDCQILQGDNVDAAIKEELDDWREDYRIASPEIFETYFKLLVPQEDRMRRFTGNYAESRVDKLFKLRQVAPPEEKRSAAG